MSADIISFDDAKAVRYLERALLGFLDDAPDSDYQVGFLNALIVVSNEGLGKGLTDDRMRVLERYAGISA